MGKPVGQLGHGGEEGRGGREEGRERGGEEMDVWIDVQTDGRNEFPHEGFCTAHGQFSLGAHGVVNSALIRMPTPKPPCSEICLFLRNWDAK